MPAYQRFINAVIKAFHEDGGATRDKLLDFAKLKVKDVNRGKVKSFLKGLKDDGYIDTDADPTDDEIEELFILLKTGTVTITLKELYDFVESTNEAGTSEPPLVWRS